MITGSHHQQIYWYATGRNRLLGQLPAAYLVAEKRWIPRRSAVLHPPGETLFSETGHWNSTCIACHTTNGRPEFDTPFGSQPIETQVVDTTRHRVRHRLRSVPRAEHRARGRQPQPAPALHVAPDRPRRSDHRAADAARPAALVAGVRPVPRRLGVLRCRRRAPGQQRGAAVSPRRRAVEDALRRATDAQPRRADDAGVARGRSGLRERLVLAGRNGPRLGP